ncbi:MAG: hypothetical protein OXT65_11645 [Alphaproteobacteria bacterium]|nr:hypothetical protein [Alphaproteobacteria bacterium]
MKKKKDKIDPVRAEQERREAVQADLQKRMEEIGRTQDPVGRYFQIQSALGIIDTERTAVGMYARDQGDAARIRGGKITLGVYGLYTLGLGGGMLLAAPAVVPIVAGVGVLGAMGGAFTGVSLSHKAEEKTKARVTEESSTWLGALSVMEKGLNAQKDAIINLPVEELVKSKNIEPLLKSIPALSVRFAEAFAKEHSMRTTTLPKLPPKANPK